MLQRFASAALVAVIAIAAGAFLVSFVPALPLRQLALIFYAWCFVPCLWGLWAMAAPKSWVPDLLPFWGAVLGLLAGFFAAIVIDLPRAVLDLEFSLGTRLGMTGAACVVYYILWTLVAVVHRRLVLGGASPTRTISKAA